MNSQTLDRANIHNLTRLWKHMGANTLKLKTTQRLYTTSTGTNRLWFDWDSAPEPQDIHLLINKAIENKALYTIPTWGQKSDALAKTLHSKKFEIVFEQTAMVLCLKTINTKRPDTPQIRPVKTAQEMKAWAEVSSQIFGVFGESIPVSLVQRIQNNRHVHLVIAWINEKAAGTGLMYEDAGIAGIHYVGILPAYRRQGLARQIMNYLIHLMQMRHCEYATLQASEMAEALYRQLRFTRQFTIRNFCRSKTQRKTSS